MSRPTRAIIDPAAFAANYRYAKSLARDSRALAVVKANGYGHGAVRLAVALADTADGFAVACSEEAMELRDSGVTQPILLLEGAFEPTEIDLAARMKFALVVHSTEQLKWLLAAKPSRPLNIWLKLDSGMHRLGLDAEALTAAYKDLRDHSNVNSIVLMSHFARADETHDAATQRQLQRFSDAVAGLDADHSLANSAAILAWPAAHAQWIRPGIMLYGSSPLDDPSAFRDRLQPAMQLSSQLIAIRDLPAGAPVGYGARFVCDRPMRVGTVAIGYADGYPRQAPDGTPVAVNGQPTRLIGRVSMDMLTIDLTDLPKAQIGDPVELWGRQINAREVADACGTITYELFTRITRRVHLEYR